MKNNKNLTSLNDFVDSEYGKAGVAKREKFETEYEAFKLGVLLQKARQEKGLTQEEMANSDARLH
jgi:HTH-type transcriptional regulator / antitoxin HipB